MNAPAIIVYSLDQATAALSAAEGCNRDILILSPPDAAASMGAGVFRALVDLVREEFPEASFTAALGCGDNAGHALAAIRQGIKALVLADDCPARQRVADIARQHGARLLSTDVYGGLGDHSNIKPPLDLMESPDPLAACRGFLHTEAAAPLPEQP